MSPQPKPALSPAYSFGALIVALLAALLWSSAAAASVPDLLVQSPEDGVTGAGAGRLGLPWGIAANPNLPGHVYIAGQVNERVDEFTAWGEFVRAWGWGVEDGSSNEFQVCTTATGCQKGIPGGGAGQFRKPEAITVDTSGNVYVMEGENHRVQKFDSEGNFILTFGLDVNKTKVEGGGTQAERNLCTKASGDACQAGKAGSGLGEFELGFPIYTNVLTTSPVTGTVFIGEGTKRIQAFNPNGSFKEEIKGGCLEGNFVHALTADAAGNLYVSFLGGTEVRKLKPTGPTAECLEPKFAVERVFALAVGPDGHLFANVEEGGGEPSRVLEFDASGACLNCGDKGEGGKAGFDRSPETEIKGLAVGAACGPTDVYASHFKSSAMQSFFRIFGEPPNVALCPPPPNPPVIAAQYALSAETGQASVQAQINPNFFPDTRYYVEYGTSSCAAGGCPNQVPLAPGSILTTKTTKSLVKTAAVVLEGLTPATTYHYRFVAVSGGGGPVFGSGAEPTPAAGGEGSFRTFAEPEVELCLVNDAFRTRASALLPDCRAYELVSPLDKGSGDIIALREFTTETPSTLDQSSTSGNRLAYGSYRSFGDAISAPFTTQYVAARGASGWASHAISPPRERLALFVSQHVDTELKALSPDLCESWWRTLAEPEPPMDPLAVPHYPNLYQRQDNECGGTAWEAITTVTPPNLPSLRYFDLELQGRSGDGSAAIYVAPDSLAGSGAPPQPPTCVEVPETVPTCALKLYYRAAGETVPDYVCFLPNGSPLSSPCSAGNYGDDHGKARMSNLAGAISTDGSRVFWSAGGGPAPIYMRENPGADETGANDGEGNCVPDPELACTIAVSKEGEELSGASGSRFWAAAADGSRAVFASGKDLYSFEVETGTTTLIAPNVLGVVGTSADAQRVYLVSGAACGGAGQVGERNLYLYEAGDECAAGEMAFVAELAAADVVPLPIKPASSAVAPEPRFHSTRVAADGLTAAFMSSGQPTGYDNADRLSGKADAEVYRYDATANGGAGELHCVSCNPSGARPLGRDINNANFWVAGQLPTWENNLYASRALSNDGQRLYFESTDALNLRDTNGIADVYQWEAPGSGGCEEEKPSFSPANGGCVDLISSGQGAQAARFHDASPDGSNVFFSTLESLLGQDYGLIDIYDARVGGGFPEPPPPAPECEGENCQGAYVPPAERTPASALFRGAGNVAEPSAKPKCKKPKVKRKGKCVKKAQKKNPKRRAQRGGGGRVKVGRARGLGAGLISLLAVACLWSSAAAASVPDLLVQSPEDGVLGAGAGRLGVSRSVAANPNLPGHVYVAGERIDEFTPWGEFVRRWGWGVEDGSNEFQVCTTATGCQAGISGGGAGQFNALEAITVDTSGNVYVIEAENHRVQKFSSEGNFILTFGLDVNKTKVEGGGTQAERNLCTKASLDVCQAGKAGSGPGELEFGFASYINRLTVSPVTGTVFVAEENKRIQAFNPNGSFKEEIKGGCLEGKVIRALTSDGAGNLYVAFAGGTEVRKLKPTGPTAECLEPKFAVERVLVLAVNQDDHLFALVEEGGGEPPRVLEFDASATCLNCGDKGEGGKPGFDRSPETEIRGLAVGAACGPADVYATHFKSSANQSFLRIFGEPPNVALCPPPANPPVIAAQYALSAETGQAIVQAQINPNFFPDTRYYVEYGTSSCAAGGCPNQQPLAPGSILTTKTTKSLVKTAAVVLEGLTPATTYHYRFVAESSGGGPVFGSGAEPTPAAGGEASFRTFASPEVEPCLVNDAFRTRAAALLPDCRAYELVSPLDKASGDVIALREFQTETPSTLDQSSVNGNRLAYGSYRSFGDAISAPFTTQYVAARGAGGWASHAISPPRERLALFVSQHVDTELKALSPDLCESWWRTLAEPEPPMDPLAVPHYPNLYQRQDNECGGTSWEALTTVTPPNLPSLRYFDLELQGRSGDGSAAIYVAPDSLAGSGAPPQPPTCIEVPETVPVCALKLYHRAAGETVPDYVCFLPNGSAHGGGCSAGSYGDDHGKARMSNLAGAISTDGTRVFWSAANGSSASGPAPLFMRENPGAEETGEDDGEGNCVPNPELACTIAVSKEGEELSGATSSRFWAAAVDGSRALFTSGKDLYSFEVDTRTTTLIAPNVLGVVGTSADAQRVYLVSEEACGGAGQVGERNLYLYEAGEECAAGEMAFVAELAAPDVVPLPIKPGSSAVAPEPRFHSTRVSADGLSAAFMSSGQPTGYDNADRISGKADAEVYRYDASANGGAGELHCVSCNPSGARPLGRDVNNADFWVAGQLPVWENNLYASRALSENGQRLYFESTDALNLRDTNGITDVYQWEAPGSGGCEEDKPSFSPANGGCVDLISSGQGAQAARFHDASPDGQNVFFSTLESLLGQDYGLIDIYDARVNGGFPEPPPPAPECEGENCQGAYVPPAERTPASALFRGAGNVIEPAAKAKSCKKPKVKHKGKCVKGKAPAKKHPKRHAERGRRGP